MLPGAADDFLTHRGSLAWAAKPGAVTLRRRCEPVAISSRLAWLDPSAR
jgi:hypothetical protein